MASLLFNHNTIAISSLVGVVVGVMGDVFPELRQYEPRIQEIIAEEEASFGRTLVKVILVFLICFHSCGSVPLILSATL